MRDDFPFYAAKCLKIRPKTGAAVSLVLNASQLQLHAVAERQRREKGRVRIIVLKGRQQGISTYVEARYYWRVSHSKGVLAYILTHLQDATDMLFEMVSRFHENCPEQMRPDASVDRAKELRFGKLDSGYRVATAGGKATGRGATIQFFHGSEVAAWPNPEEHAAGVMQAIADVDGSESILESTSGGPTGWFFEQWELAKAGKSEYEAVFLPWFLEPSYAIPAGKNTLNAEEKQYAARFALNASQMAWRRKKIAELGELRFCREYPATEEEAFEASAESLIPLALVREAMRRVYSPSTYRESSKIIGVDVARHGKDYCVIALRQGVQMRYVKAFRLRDTNEDTMDLANRIADHIEAEDPWRVCIGVTGIGWGVFDVLKRWGYGPLLVAVVEGANAQDQTRFTNKRTELYARMLQWLREGGALPDDKELEADMVMLGADIDDKGRMQLESKQGGKSPDRSDAGSFTFEPSERAAGRRGASEATTQRTSGAYGLG